MNIDPAKMKKKDLVFMEFFSMYGKNFINNKKDSNDQLKKKQQKKQAPTSSFKDLFTNM